MPKPTTRIELSRTALQNNLAFLRDTIGPNVVISSVIKGNAYGHGIEVFAPLLWEEGQRHFSVFSADEAQRVRRVLGAAAEIMIMGWLAQNEVAWAVENDVSFFVFDIERLREAQQAAESTGKPARIHLEVETGMNRTGVRGKDLPEILDFIKKHAKFFELEGVCTHLAGAESVANYLRVRRQLTLFRRFLRELKREGLQPKYRHAACSAGTIAYPSAIFDMVRIGILQYGFWPSPENQMQYLTQRNQFEDPLRRVISWYTEIMSVHEVGMNQFVGYGTSYLTQEPLRVAVLPVGYSHGYSRGLSNQGRVLIDGKRLPIIGVINMNHALVNINEVPEAGVGDEVMLIGRQGDINLTVASFATLSDQLNYEMLTRLPSNIPRLVVD